MLSISIVCSDPLHPVNEWLNEWARANADEAIVTIVRKPKCLEGGDFLFLISCHDIVSLEMRSKFRYALVIHASDLPTGRGWSPMAWDVLGGADSVTVSLLDVDDPVDSGKVWQKRRFRLDGTELLDELNEKLFHAELALMSWALQNCDVEKAQPQSGKITHHRKRTAADSEIDPCKSLAENFDLLRITDADRYPAFFSYRGARYKIQLEKICDD